MSRLNPSALTIGLLLACGASAGLAQTAPKPAPAKPAAAPAATGNEKTLGGGQATGKIMSINELRECLKRQDALKVTGADLTAQQAEQERGREAIQKEVEAINAERDAMTKQNDAVRDFNERMKAYAERVKAWNERSQAFNENTRTGPAVERERRDLAAEKTALEKLEVANKADGEALTRGQQESAKAVNTRVASQQAMANAWNERNAKLVDAANVYDEKRAAWRAECGERRYREDDEKALRSEMK